jgi:hypothetical protein
MVLDPLVMGNDDQSCIVFFGLRLEKSDHGSGIFII